MYVLDTNTLIYFFKGMGQVATRIETTSPNEIAIPTVVLFELYVGIANSQNPEPRQQLLDNLISQIVILPFDQQSSRCAALIRAQLEKAGTPIGPIDTLIAGIAKCRGATLVTHNVKEFSRIAELLIEDWY
ncbi:nucleotide-binding protein [Leptolyngbya sp. Heron Island J]|uniref:type II toxin-antitoxin system VapC family toxin n=1 Tax=Leptolyngbya sp. Heron Island J TaxID=1385935 RepID=UPI0003B99D86|nr:type II toxin-antitoxin system VapC family toxin [Leptolyngbya sp. Heron Island J]ESA32739.1 nucleotide-binding protein [Leptolyngbya sp. Heron Island J]